MMFQVDPPSIDDASHGPAQAQAGRRPGRRPGDSLRLSRGIRVLGGTGTVIQIMMIRLG
jgi:hypothetical protein